MPQIACHLIKSTRQIAKLILVFDMNFVNCQISVGNLGSGCPEQLNRIGDLPADQNCQQCCCYQRYNANTDDGRLHIFCLLLCYGNLFICFRLFCGNHVACYFNKLIQDHTLIDCNRYNAL
ncbi:hypothetical protein D3C73_1171850 [compost metagenome]